MKKVFFILCCVAILCSCTEQSLSRQFGGSMKIELKPGEKLIEATWKDNNLWYLTEPMDSDYVPKTKIFKESSNWGVAEGDVTFIETR